MTQLRIMSTMTKNGHIQRLKMVIYFAKKYDYWINHFYGTVLINHTVKIEPTGKLILLGN